MSEQQILDKLDLILKEVIRLQVHVDAMRGVTAGLPPHRSAEERAPAQETLKPIPEGQGNNALDPTSYAMVNDMLGMHRAPRDLEREERLRQRDQTEAERPIRGNFHVSALEDDDKLFLAAMSGPYKDATGGDLRESGLLGGLKYEIDAAFGAGEGMLRNRGASYHPDNYNGLLRNMLDRMMGKTK